MSNKNERSCVMPHMHESSFHDSKIKLTEAELGLRLLLCSGFTHLRKEKTRKKKTEEKKGEEKREKKRREESLMSGKPDVIICASKPTSGKLHIAAACDCKLELQITLNS